VGDAKLMASASSSVTLAGKVRKTKITRDGTAVVVKKTIGDATLEERYPKRRMTGKRKDTAQAIPVEDVIRGMESYAETIEPEVQRRVEGVNQFANQLLDKEIAKQKNRTRHQAGRAAAAKQATRAARQAADRYRQEVNSIREADAEIERKQRATAESLRAKTAQRAAELRRRPAPSRTALGL
jgi:DNA repair exonuclease SbcCD ATPase subunit